MGISQITKKRVHIKDLVQTCIMFLGAIFSSNMHSLSRSETENALPLPQLNLTVSPDVHDSIAFPNMCHCYILDKRKTVALSQVSCTIAISGSRSTLESSL